MTSKGHNSNFLKEDVEIIIKKSSHIRNVLRTSFMEERVFVTAMEHAGNDPELRYSMECTGFQVTMLRGAEWAASGKVTQNSPQDFPSEEVITLRKQFKYLPR